MPAKSADLRRAILDQAGGNPAAKRRRAGPPDDAAPHPAARAVQPGRTGKVAVTGYFAPEVRRQLKRLGEALNDLFAKHCVAEIAGSDPSRRPREPRRGRPPGEISLCPETGAGEAPVAQTARNGATAAPRARGGRAGGLVKAGNGHRPRPSRGLPTLCPPRLDCLGIVAVDKAWITPSALFH